MKHPTIEQVIQALEQSWSGETCYPKVSWTIVGPARGQCAVSALIIQDYFGGDLGRREVWFEGEKEKHFINLLSNGDEIDVTRSQYPADIELVDATPNLKDFKSLREKLIADEDTSRRYQLLKSKVVAYLEGEV